MNNFRIGNGFDIHTFAPGRKLFLGGVEIPNEEGLLGHSDADVILHALCDAMLGALSLGDIGKHFPNTDDRFKDIDSKKLLSHVNELILSKGYKLSNADVMVLAEKPKLASHIPSMRKIIAEILGVAKDDISIKATTTEKLGAIGRAEGIAAYAVVLLYRFRVR